MIESEYFEIMFIKNMDVTNVDKCDGSNWFTTETKEKIQHYYEISTKHDNIRDASINNIYRRQEVWLKACEKKKKEARVKKESRIVENITGRPELKSAKESWEKAKG